MPHTGAVTAWSEPTTQEKGALLSSIYEMAGIKPPAECVERWLIAGWPHVCEGLTAEQVYEAFMMVIAGKLRDSSGKKVTLDLYGGQFSLMVFAKVIDAYRSHLARQRQEMLEQQAKAAEERRRLEDEMRNVITPEEDLRNRRRLTEKAYEEPDKYEDWGGVMYACLERNGLLSEIEGLTGVIAERAAKRLAAQKCDLMRAAADPEYRKRFQSRKPDVRGETVRFWFEFQKETKVTLEEVYVKLHYTTVEEFEAAKQRNEKNNL